MQLLDKVLCQFLICMVDDVVDAAEMIYGLQHVINVEGCIDITNCIRFEDKTCLVVGKAVSFYMVRIVGQVYLGAMIDSSL